MSGLVGLGWITAGEFSCLAFIPYSDGGLRPMTRFLVLRCVFSWVLWAILLGVCFWESSHTKRHYPQAEWGSSIQTLDTFDTADPDDTYWIKTGDGTFVRAAELGYRGTGVTPYREVYTVPPNNKEYDLPPDIEEAQPGLPFTPGPVPPALVRHPAWKTRLARGDYILGPDVAGPSSWKKPVDWSAAYLPAAKYDPTTKRSLSEDEGEPSSSTGNAAGGGIRLGKWVPEDRYMGEKMRIVEGSFGPALSRTQSL